MPPTTGYRFGEVVLVPFPFTDQSGIKKRPAVIVSSAAYQLAFTALASEGARLYALGCRVIVATEANPPAG